MAECPFPLEVNGGDLERASVFQSRHDLNTPTLASNSCQIYRIGITAVYSNDAGQIRLLPEQRKSFGKELGGLSERPRGSQSLMLAVEQITQENATYSLAFTEQR